MLLPWPWYPPAVRLSNRSADGYPANPPALPPNPTAMRLLGHTTGRHPTRPSTGPAAISPYATGESHRRQIPARGTWLEPCTHMKPTLTPLPIRIRLQSPFPNPAFPRHHRVGRRLPIWRLMPFISLMSFISLIFHHHRHLFVSEPRHWQIHHQCIRCCSSAPTASLRRTSNGERRASAADNNRESTENQQGIDSGSITAIARLRPTPHVQQTATFPDTATEQDPAMRHIRRIPSMERIIIRDMSRLLS